MFDLGLAGSAMDFALSNARSFAAGKTSKAQSSLRSYQESRISRGRPGFPKKLAAPKMGISNSSRAILNQISNASIIGGDALFATSVDYQYSIESMQTQILAMRARYAKSNPEKLAPHLRPDYDPDAEKGSKVDVKT